MKALAVMAVIRLLGSLPLSLLRRLGGLFGAALYYSDNRAEKVTDENLQLCLPQLSAQARTQLAKSSLRESGKFAFESCAVWSRNRRWMLSKIGKIYGEELLQRELAQHRGLIVLSPHIGNWEVLGRYLNQFGEMTSLYQPPKQVYLEAVIRESRQRDGATLVPTTRKGVALLLEALKRGEITGILPDQCPEIGSGEFAPFYQHPAYTMTLIQGLVRRTGSTVLMGVALRVSGGFEVHFLEPDADIYAEDKHASLAAMNRSVERCIALAPEQYQWEYKRFRRQPEGLPKRYVFTKEPSA